MQPQSPDASDRQREIEDGYRTELARRLATSTPIAANLEMLGNLLTHLLTYTEFRFPEGEAKSLSQMDLVIMAQIAVDEIRSAAPSSKWGSTHERLLNVIEHHLQRVREPHVKAEMLSSIAEMRTSVAWLKENAEKGMAADC